MGALRTGLWQMAAIEEIVDHLRSDEDVRALVLAGSSAGGTESLDPWSDVDLAVVVTDAAWDRFHPSTEWLSAFGDLFTVQVQTATGLPQARRSAIRACFVDMRRVDFILFSESAFAQPETWPSNPFAGGSRVVFARTPQVAAALSRPTPTPEMPSLSADQLAELANQFWFKATLAVAKAMRDDLLIGLHLALDLVRDCCVLGMLLRDRAEGTRHHRFGGPYNEVVERLEAARQPHTRLGVLDSVEQSAVAFDALAAEWSDDYRERRQPLLAWIDYARRSLGGANEHR